MTRAAQVKLALIVLIVAGLAYDVYAHFDLASMYDGVKQSGTLSQGDLFRVEGVVAIIVGVAVAVRPRRYTAIVALVVAASALGAVLLYRYTNPGKIWFLPNMTDKEWEPPGKKYSAIAEAIATLASIALLVQLQLEATGSARPRPGPGGAKAAA